MDQNAPSELVTRESAVRIGHQAAWYGANDAIWEVMYFGHARA